MTMNKFNFRIKSATFVAIILLSPLSCWAGQIAAQEKRVPDPAPLETVARVLDGDTFILSDGRKVRLIGVDTPEKGEAFSNEARDFADSVLVGHAIRIEQEKIKEDRYGRLLGYVFIDDLFFNEMLIKRGLAHVYLFKENKRFNKRLIQAQSEARKSRTGIWSLDKPSDEPFYLSAGGSFRFHRPLCPLIKNINQKKARKYKTREEALDEGLSPCRECHP
jgi:micrococcal nuclease